MKIILLKRVVSCLTALGILCASASCTTTYDHMGRPVQAMDPDAAAVAVAAICIIGLALAIDGGPDDYYDDSYYGGYGGYGGRGRCR